jgi:hypothetical protein
VTDDAFVDQVLTDLAFITEHWTDLLENRQPGTARPWRQALIDPERRAATLARDRDERAERDPDAPGFTSAPLHVDVLDVITDIWVTLDELANLISPDWRNTRAAGALDRTNVETHAPAPVTHINGMVALIRTWLPVTAPALPEHRGDRIARRLHALTTDVDRVLGLVRAGQLLNGATCPWCRGVTPKHPAGGAITMRVEQIPGSTRMGTEPAPAVVCWNPLCDPPEDKCGTRYRGRPAWPWHEWDWLSQLLIVADPQPSAPTPLPPRPEGFSSVPVEPIERFGASGSAAPHPPRRTSPPR